MSNPNPDTSGLIPFKPGQSGNPKGKPKGSGLTARLRKIVEESDHDVAEALMKAGVKAALKGDYRFWAHIFDRLDGPVTQKQDQDVTYRIVRDENP
jgi:hypothetical protein